MLPARKFTSENYRYGFNGQERSDEIKGAGNSNTAMFWEYDTRLGRRWNLDPKPFESISAYSAFLNNPILMNDPLGDTTYLYTTNGHFMGTVLDKLKSNEIVFIQKELGNAILNLSKSKKYSDNTLASVARNPNFAYARLTSRTGKEMFKSRQKNVGGVERMGLLWIDPDSKELKLWECKDCGVSYFESDESKMFDIRDFSFKGEKEVLGSIFAKWHTHTGTSYSDTSPSPDWLISNEYSYPYLDYYIPEKLSKDGIIGVIVSDKTFTIFNMKKNGNPTSTFKRFDINKIGEKNLK